MEILAIAALVPVIVLMVLIYRADKADKEPVKLIVLTLVLGALSCIPAVIIEVIYDMVAGSVAPAAYEAQSVGYLFFEYFLGVALVEEFCKGGAMMLAVWKKDDFNYVFDGIVYCAAAALGFAGLENLTYVLDPTLGGVDTAVARGILSVPGHCSFGIAMGYFVGRAKFQKYAGNKARMKQLLLLGLLVPTAMHGAYDFGLSVNDATGLAAIGAAFAFDIAAIVYVKKGAKNDVPIRIPQKAPRQPYVPPQQPYVPPQAQVQPQPQTRPVAPVRKPVAKFCPNCGAPNAGGAFCPHCGNKF